jgi:hypothetical protein
MHGEADFKVEFPSGETRWHDEEDFWHFQCVGALTRSLATFRRKIRKSENFGKDRAWRRFDVGYE